MPDTDDTPSRRRPLAVLADELRIVRGLRSNPNIGQELKRSHLFRLVTSALPPKFLRHWVYPRMVGKDARAYDAERFFSSFYRASETGSVSDSATVSPTHDALTTRYHYAVTEKALIECLAKHRIPAGGRVLDVGSGAGHWIALYRELLRPERIVGLDIVQASVDALAERLRDVPEADVRLADVASPDFDLGERFDLVNAIGVLFHVVEDAAWERAIANLARHLEPGGHMIVGGQFGRVTANVQFHGSDEFSDWSEGASAGARLVNKRIRSLPRWKAAAREAGLSYVAVHRTVEVRTIFTPENNILLLEKPDRS